MGVVTVTAKGKGSATITVSVAAGTNHTAPANKTCSVEVTLPTKVLNDNSWATIREVSSAGLGANYWAVGDVKEIKINGKVGNTTFSNLAVNVFILGFNHNSAREGGNKIHFQIATADGVVCDSMVCYALVPLSDGDVGVLSDHAPMIGALKEGVVKYVSEGEDHFAAISGGVLSVADNEVSCLHARQREPRPLTLPAPRRPSAERVSALRAEQPMLTLKRAELSLQRAIAREKAYTMLHK